ncbi:MAG: hypothetical protein DYG99_13880 [Bacteroidetes bacterium CHB5]|nr:hypothetical protein [Bacteroidetes bacterium CHB5]
MLELVPSQIGDTVAVTVNPASIAPATVTVAVVVNWAGGHTPRVANTLNVVVAVRAPVGNSIVAPVPATGDPTGLLSALFLS